MTTNADTLPTFADAKKLDPAEQLPRLEAVALTALRHRLTESQHQHAPGDWATQSAAYHAEHAHGHAEHANDALLFEPERHRALIREHLRATLSRCAMALAVLGDA